MPSLLLYLLKLSISLSIVWIFYQLFLRRLTFYGLNRWYLLGYSLLSFFIPLIDIGPMLEEGSWGDPLIAQYIPAIGHGGVGFARAAAVRPVLTGWDGVIGLIGLGAMLLLLRMVRRWLSLRRLRRGATLIADAELKIYQVDAPILPFSFGGAIYINQHLHTERELGDIILHEYVHIRQKHTVDILLAELICILNWYNPFCWLMRWSIRQNLEFIADQQVLEKGVDKKGYQYHLLKVMGVPAYRLANNFNFSSLKKRIVMMNKIRSTRLQLLKFLFVLPLAAMLLVAFRDKRMVRTVRVENVTGNVGVVTGGPAVGKKNDAVTLAAPRRAIVRAEVRDTSDPRVIFSDQPGNMLYVVDGKEMPNGWKPDSVPTSWIATVTVVKGEQAARLFGKRGVNGVVAIQLKDKIPVSGQDSVALKNKIRDYTPLYIIDGKEVLMDTVSGVDANTIERIDILNPKSANAKYGDRGKSGVILITLKKIVGVVDTMKVRNVTLTVSKPPAGN